MCRMDDLDDVIKNDIGTTFRRPTIYYYYIALLYTFHETYIGLFGMYQG